MNKLELLYELATGPALNLMLEAQFGGPGVQQSIGTGRNIHTLDPQPITWENYEGLKYEVDASPDGKYYAEVEVLDYPEMSPPLQTFSDEASATSWVRNTYEILHRNLMAMEASR